MTTPQQPATERLDALWAELELDALASDGPIRDRDVKDAIKRHRPAIEAEAAAGLLALREALEEIRDWYNNGDVGPTEFGNKVGEIFRRALADTAPAAAEIEARIAEHAIAEFVERFDIRLRREQPATEEAEE